MKKKKVLILGVTGQDGSFMARLLLKKKYQVHGFIRKSATGNLKNIKDIIKEKNFYIHHGDLLDSTSLTKTIKNIHDYRKLHHKFLNYKHLHTFYRHSKPKLCLMHIY